MLKKGFTLSEVLITLAIIGVITIITIPSFVKNYKKKVYATKIVKVAAQIQDAVDQEMGQENSTDLGETALGQTDGAVEFFDQYFKLAKKGCTNCFATSYKTTSGESTVVFGGGYTVQTVDGVVIKFSINRTDLDNVHVDVAIDTNGPEEPNIVGYDIFYLIISHKGKLYDPPLPEYCNVKSVNWGHIGDYARGCYKKIIEDGGKITY